MNEAFEAIKNFFAAHEDFFLVVGLVSAALFACTLVLVPVAVVALPEDYFTREKPAGNRRLFALRVFSLVARNVLGIVLLLLGILLLILPGPGWLTILAGVALIDLPFKRRLEIKILSLPVVRNAVNGLRAKRGKKPLQFPDSDVNKSR
ncbi:MAG: hypothetical protein JXD23_03430 [Spirochaetales bacterium]|nr:hypothetical protein [Spirochaetales bacterium]